MLLFGDKTLAMFDVWSIEHFVSGMNAYCLIVMMLARTLHSSEGRPSTLPIRAYRSLVLGWILALAFAWEALEFYLETGMAGEVVAHWFQGVEHWSNRLITAPLLIILGAMAMRNGRKRWLAMPAKVFSGVWLFVHIVLFPHSMYLHELMK